MARNKSENPSDPERPPIRPRQSSHPSKYELQLIEAEWVTKDMQETIKLVQQYRALYLTAVFLAIAWLLAQLIPKSTVTTEQIQQTLDILTLRDRVDIALLLCGIALLNLLFTALILEAYINWRSLARYRFVLGYALGKRLPSWRYEAWKNTPEGSTSSWTNPLNIFYFSLSTLITVSVLGFSMPALLRGPLFGLKIIWFAIVGLFVGIYVRVVVLAIRIWRGSSIADPPKTFWDDLK